MQPLMESGGWRGSHGGEPGDRHDDMEEEPGSPVNPFAGIAAKPFATGNVSIFLGQGGVGFYVFLFFLLPFCVFPCIDGCVTIAISCMLHPSP